MKLFPLNFLFMAMFSHPPGQGACPGGVCPMRRPQAPAPVSVLAPMPQLAPRPQLYGNPAPQLQQRVAMPAPISFVPQPRPIFRQATPPPFLPLKPTANYRPFTPPVFSNTPPTPLLSQYRPLLPATAHPAVLNRQYTPATLTQLGTKAQKEKSAVKAAKGVKVAKPLEEITNVQNTHFAPSWPAKDLHAAINRTTVVEGGNVTFSLPLKKIQNMMIGGKPAELRLVFSANADNANDIQVSHSFIDPNEPKEQDPLLVRAAHQISNVTHNIVQGSKNAVNKFVDAIVPDLTDSQNDNDDSGEAQLKIDAAIDNSLDNQAILDASSSIAAF